MTTAAAGRPRRREGAAAAALFLFGSVAGAQTAPAETAAARRERVRALAATAWEVRAHRASGPLSVDGRFDEPDWAAAEPIVDFFQRDRNEGLPATERTEVRVLYDVEALYIGFTCFDRDMVRSKARGRFRDENGGADDLVSVMLDAYHDHRTAIQFVTNASGLVEDLFQNGETESTRNHDWDTVWTSRGARYDDRWTSEIRIPFRSLRFESPDDGGPLSFGIGMKRNIPRKNEEVYWPFVPNDSSWYRPAELGHLVGIAGARPGRNLDLLPYALGSVERARVDRARDRERIDGGLDLKWGLRPGLTADFTLNTAFAQEEVDSQQINLTRFSLFFPEKRQFFLEGQREFTIGVPGEAPLVFTRRIGLSAGGDVVPVAAGARVSGREGAWTIGAMDIGTRATDTTPAENFAVLRLRRDLGRRSGVGLLATNRSGGGRFNRVGALDATLSSGAWTAEGFAAAVRTEEDRPRSGGHHVRLAYQTDRIGATLRRLDLGDAFDPGVGYVQRPGAEQHFASFRWSPRRRGLVRQFHVEPRLTYITDQDRALDTRDAGVKASADFDSGDQMSVEYASRREVLVEPFRIRADTTVPPGAYDTAEWSATLTTFRRRHLRGTFTAKTGEFWNGRRRAATADWVWRLSRFAGLQSKYEWNKVTLPARTFTTHLVSARLDLVFRTDLILLSLFQYNSDTRQASTNVRLNWIPKPGTDFFVVYNELDGTRVAQNARGRSVSVKLTYRFAL